MASPSSTNDDLLTSIKVSSFFVNNPTHVITDAQMLVMATEELMLKVAPTLKAQNLGFYLAETSYSLASGTASTGYRIPARSAGNTLARLFVVDSSAERQAVGVYPEGTPILYQTTSVTGRTPRYAGGAYSAFIRNAKVYLSPFPNGAVTLIMQYYTRPGDLVLSTACSTVLSHTSTSITLAGTISGLTTGVKFDVIDSLSPYQYKYTDLTGTVAGTTISGLTDTTDIEDGDWVALRCQSPVSQLPHEWQTYLRWRTLARIQLAAGYSNDAAASLGIAEETLKDLTSLISPRVDGQPNIIQPNEIFDPGWGGGW